jgi:hypothetical protein
MKQYTGVERRTGLIDRRTATFDRRQFIAISWPIDRDRRVSKEDRRTAVQDRRGEQE